MTPTTTPTTAPRETGVERVTPIPDVETTTTEEAAGAAQRRDDPDPLALLSLLGLAATAALVVRSRR